MKYVAQQPINYAHTTSHLETQFYCLFMGYATWLVHLPSFFVFLIIANLVFKTSSQDSHHNYNSSQRFTLIKVPLELWCYVVCTLYLMHLTTHVHLNFCAFKLMCISTPMLLMVSIVERWTLIKKNMPPFKLDDNQAPFLIDYLVIWCQINVGGMVLYW